MPFGEIGDLGGIASQGDQIAGLMALQEMVECLRSDMPACAKIVGAGAAGRAIN